MQIITQHPQYITRTPCCCRLTDLNFMLPTKLHANGFYGLTPACVSMTTTYRYEWSVNCPERLASPQSCHTKHTGHRVDVCSHASLYALALHRAPMMSFTHDTFGFMWSEGILSIKQQNQSAQKHSIEVVQKILLCLVYGNHEIFAWWIHNYSVRRACKWSTHWLFYIIYVIYIYYIYILYVLFHQIHQIIEESGNANISLPFLRLSLGLSYHYHYTDKI